MENNQTNSSEISYSGTIYLYGETHGIESTIAAEFEIWNEFYQQGMRHLFLELPYYTAEYLNLWMKSANDQILNEVYSAWRGTASYNQFTRDFYIRIKDECPHTIFHGTDVGHQYDTTGYRFLQYLQDNSLTDTVQYERTIESIEQGKMYYQSEQDDVYRENVMVENFITELLTVNNQDVMGIFGAAHTGIEDLNFSGKVPAMANQLTQILNSEILSTDLRNLPIRTDVIEIDGKAYSANYFGVEHLTGVNDIDFREFWRIENAYDDLKDADRSGDVLPYNNFPMPIEIGQVFIVKYHRGNGETFQTIYISDGKIWNNQFVTQNIVVRAFDSW